MLPYLSRHWTLKISKGCALSKLISAVATLKLHSSIFPKLEKSHEAAISTCSWNKMSIECWEQCEVNYASDSTHTANGNCLEIVPVTACIELVIFSDVLKLFPAC